MVRHHVRQPVEPPQRQLGEDDALVGDGRVEDEVEGRDLVGGHHQQPVVVGRVQLPDLALVQQRAGPAPPRTSIQSPTVHHARHSLGSRRLTGRRAGWLGVRPGVTPKPARSRPADLPLTGEGGAQWRVWPSRHNCSDTPSQERRSDGSAKCGDERGPRTPMSTLVRPTHDRVIAGVCCRHRSTFRHLRQRRAADLRAQHAAARPADPDLPGRLDPDPEREPLLITSVGPVRAGSRASGRCPRSPAPPG